MRVRYFQKIARLLAGLALVSGLAGCNYRELSELYYGSAQVWISVDWSKFTKEVPSGMSVYCYPRDNKDRTEPYVYLSNDISGVLVNLPLGTYDVMVFNQSVDEFGSMRFENMNQFSTACAILEDYDTKWSVKADDQGVAYEPEWLAIDTYEEFTVTLDMIKGKVTTITLYPENVVYTTNVTVRIYGTNNVRSVRGSMTGMAQAIMMSTGIRSSVPVTHALENWTMNVTDKARGYGEVVTSFRTFGLPAGTKAINTNRKADYNILHSSFLLVDDKTITDASFKVGNRLDVDDVKMEINLKVGYGSDKGQDPGEGVDPDKPIVIPDVNPTGGGGFTAILNDWDADQEIEIPINGK